MLNGIKEDTFQILIRIDSLCAPHQRVSHVGSIYSEQFMVHLKAEMLCQQDGKHDNTAGPPRGSTGGRWR